MPFLNPELVSVKESQLSSHRRPDSTLFLGASRWRLLVNLIGIWIATLACSANALLEAGPVVHKSRERSHHRLSRPPASATTASQAQEAVAPRTMTTTANGAKSSGTASPETRRDSPAESPSFTSDASQSERCLQTLHKTVRAENQTRLAGFCDPRTVNRLPVCHSVENRPIHHSEFLSTDSRGKRILVLGLFHGDEPLAGEMALEWSARLGKLEGYRNSWRLVPMLNPDGLERGTRMNARGVDLNRNFPTKDWARAATKYWQERGKSDPRRYPGESAGSESETKCAIAHIKDFRPDFIVAVHTPYRVLDFDGPRMPFPRYKDLPWRALGNFPGSLGRYMWKDYSIPVLTVELGSKMIDSAELQDLVGTFAIEASRRSGQKTAGLFEAIDWPLTGH